MNRTPPGVVDALAAVMHEHICMSNHETPHSWRDHSGTGYRDLGKEAVAALADRGYTFTRGET